MCRFTYYYLLKWFQDDLNKICVKVATNESFSLYFNVNFMTSQRRQFSSEFDENTFLQQRKSLRSYSYQFHAPLQLIYKALKKKNYHPRKLTKISTFSCFRQSATQKRRQFEKLFLCQNDRNTVSLDQPEPREAKILRF